MNTVSDTHTHNNTSGEGLQEGIYEEKRAIHVDNLPRMSLLILIVKAEQ